MRERLTHPLALVLLAGFVLRAALIADYRPAFLSYSDSGAYLVAAGRNLFSDPLRGAGYNAMLSALNAIGDLGVLVVVQHGLGLATAAVAYLGLRRLGAPRWAGLVPAVAVAVSIDQLTFEHAVLTEAPFTALLVAGMAAAAAALGRDDLRWWAAAGLLLGAAFWVRNAGMFVLPLAGLAALLAAGDVRRRLVRATVYAVPALVLLVGYLALQQHFYGAGLGGASGWGNYARAAPFADCRVFTPPAGTEALCESTPVTERPSPDFYAWSADSPAQRLLGNNPPYRGEIVGRFGRAAMKAQPKAYLTTVAKDLWRYVLPGANARRGDAVDVQGMPIDLEHPLGVSYVLPNAERFYGARQEVRKGPVTDAYAAVQELTRLQGIWMLAALLLTVVALVRLRGPARLFAALLGAASAVLLVMPVASTVFNLRYAVPVMPLLAMSAALGAWALSARGRTSVRRR